MTDEIDRLEALLRPPRCIEGPFKVVTWFEQVGIDSTTNPQMVVASFRDPGDAAAFAALGSVGLALLETVRKQHAALQAVVSAGPNVLALRQGAWNEARDAEEALSARIREVLGEADRG